MEIKHVIILVIDFILLLVVFAYIPFISGRKAMRRVKLKCYQSILYYLLFALFYAIINDDSFYLAVATVFIVLCIDVTCRIIIDRNHPILLMNILPNTDCEVKVSKYLEEKGIGVENYKLSKKRKIILLLELENVVNYKEIFKELGEKFQRSERRNWINIYVIESFVFLVFTLLVIAYTIITVFR